MDTPHDIARELARRYGTLQKDDLKVLASMLRRVRVRRGDKLLVEGEVSVDIYYIERGLLRQYYEKNGKVLTEHIGSEGDIVMCIESLFAQTASVLTVQALEPSIVYALSFNALQQRCEQSVDFCRILLSILKESLILSWQKADTLQGEDAYSRYNRTLTEHPEIVRRAPLHILASYLQMRPETLSRVRARDLTSST